MDVPAEANVFVSYAITDAYAEPILDELSQTFSVATARSVVGPMESRAALRAAMDSAAVVVVVLPPPGNRDRPNVIFETGVAVGMGLSVLVVSREAKLPRSLLDLPVVTSSTLASLEDMVREAARRGPVDVTGQEQTPHAVREQIGHAPSRMARPEERLSFLREQELAAYLADIFRTAGAEVVIPSPRLTDRKVDNADLVIWDDNILPIFGAPLPVEILRSMHSSTKVRSKLLKTLHASGAHSILAVAATGRGSWRWTDGHALILTVAAESLVEQLEYKPLAAALASLLEAAAV